MLCVAVSEDNKEYKTGFVLIRYNCWSFSERCVIVLDINTLGWKVYVLASLESGMFTVHSQR